MEEKKVLKEEETSKVAGGQTKKSTMKNIESGT